MKSMQTNQQKNITIVYVNHAKMYRLGMFERDYIVILPSTTSFKWTLWVEVSLLISSMKVEAEKNEIIWSDLAYWVVQASDLSASDAKQ